VGVEGHGLLGSAGLGNGQAHTEDGVGTELGLVGGAIEVNQELVDLGLVLDVDVLLDDGGRDDLVDVLDGLEDALAAPLGLVAVAELASLVLACVANIISFYSRLRRSHWCDEPVEAPEGTMARWRPSSVTTSTSTVGLPRES
jgi:hypothetical protein